MGQIDINRRQTSSFQIRLHQPRNQRRPQRIVFLNGLQAPDSLNKGQSYHGESFPSLLKGEALKEKVVFLGLANRLSGKVVSQCRFRYMYRKCRNTEI